MARWHQTAPKEREIAIAKNKKSVIIFNVE